jgi:CheY-like chemotaxis protein
MVVNHLVELGYSVLEAPDGPSAMAFLADGAQQIDLLFTDIVMPGGMDGYDLARAARELRPGLNLLFTSGYADNALAKGAQSSEVPMLKKPYRDGELATLVRHVLDGQVERKGASGQVAMAS